MRCTHNPHPFHVVCVEYIVDMDAMCPDHVSRTHRFCNRLYARRLM